MDPHQHPIPNTQRPIPSTDPDEINLLEYIYVLVKNKWWIIGLTIAGLVIGYIAALIKGPTWVAEAVKEGNLENQKVAVAASTGCHGEPFDKI